MTRPLTLNRRIVYSIDRGILDSTLNTKQENNIFYRYRDTRLFKQIYQTLHLALNRRIIYSIDTGIPDSTSRYTRLYN